MKTFVFINSNITYCIHLHVLKFDLITMKFIKYLTMELSWHTYRTEFYSSPFTCNANFFSRILPAQILKCNAVSIIWSWTSIWAGLNSLLVCNFTYYIFFTFTKVTFHHNMKCKQWNCIVNENWLYNYWHLVSLILLQSFFHSSIRSQN